MNNIDLYTILRNASKVQLTAFKRIADNSTRDEFMCFLESNFEEAPNTSLSGDEIEALRMAVSEKPCWCYTSRSSMTGTAITSGDTDGETLNAPPVRAEADQARPSAT